MIGKFKVFENVFSKEECNQILNKCVNESVLKMAEVYDSKLMNNVIDVSKRKSKVAGIDLEELNDRIIKKLKEYFGIKGYNFKISNYQFTKYQNGDYFNWHTDSSDDVYNQRILTIVIQLNDEYEGGELELEIDGKVYSLKKGIGNLFAFSSLTKHRIKEIKNGVRYSIVNWLELETQKNYKKTLL